MRKGKASKAAHHKGVGEYNTVKTDNIVNDDENRRFLRALSSCVCLTPDEEERILPKRRPSEYHDPDADFNERLCEVDEIIDEDGTHRIVVPNGPTRRQMQDEEAYLNNLADAIDESEQDLIHHFLMG